MREMRTKYRDHKIKEYSRAIGEEHVNPCKECGELIIESFKPFHHPKTCEENKKYKEFLAGDTINLDEKFAEHTDLKKKFYEMNE